MGCRAQKEGVRDGVRKSKGRRRESNVAEPASEETGGRQGKRERQKPDEAKQT